MISIRILSLFIGLLAWSGHAHAITLGQVDDFQDGTTLEWFEGNLSPNPPINEPNTGPTGAGDHALSNVSTGSFGPGSRMIMFNNAQWTGDYLSAGVDQISLMMRADPATNSLSMRVAIQGVDGSRYASNDAFNLDSDGNWYPAKFDLSSNNMTLLEGTQSLDEVLASVSELRILSAASPSWIADPVEAKLFVDNITAVPEPSGSLAIIAAWMALLQVAGRGGFRRGRSNRRIPSAF